MDGKVGKKQVQKKQAQNKKTLNQGKNKQKVKRCTYRRKIAVVVVTKKGKNGKRGATYATSYYVPVSKNRKGKPIKLNTKVEVEEDPIPVKQEEEPSPPSSPEPPQVRKPVPED